MAEHQALLDQLARLKGLGEAYYDHRGELRYFSAAARRAILQAMGQPVGDEGALRAAIERETHMRSSAIRSNPGICFQLPALESRRSWGLSVQLYTLRSARNWGHGDFADLRELIALAAPLGCDVVGLNPLHALFVADPTQCSPYSPSSRIYLNILYIAVDAVPEFASCEPAQVLIAQPAFQMALAGLRAIDNVMYDQVATLKLTTLRLLHEHFVTTQLAADTDRARSYGEFIARHGESLRRHAVFDVLDMHFRDRGLHGWRNWPAEFHDPNSTAVHEFANVHGGQVDFLLYAQWIADEQFSGAQRFAREQGMRIGLYGDLAVGANPDGSEVWSNQKLYIGEASVGAPPDPLALSGQDWGIPPIDPNELRAQNYAPFIELVRANMRHVGALRVDHVMSLFRLWWVPRGFGAIDGVYVHYPLEELVAVIASESGRAQCLVIGEDLGTVPDEIRNIMESSKLFHYKVLLFEKRDGNFKSPNEYPHHSIATAATHDLPPLKAWWQGDDLALRDRLRLYPSADTAQQLHSERAADRIALLRAINNAGLWFWQSHEAPPDYSLALARAIHLFIGKSEAALALVQLEDLIGMTDPVNVPGTHTEHANWQRKLIATTQDIFGHEDVVEMLTALGQARHGENPNR